nr:hypothetical protein [Pseudomonas sp. Irchel s3h14]
MIVSTASLLIGVAAANASHATLLVTGMAGLVAGASFVGCCVAFGGGFHRASAERCAMDLRYVAGISRRPGGLLQPRPVVPYS